MRQLSFCIAMLIATLCGVASAADPSSRKPNVILILADDLGYADVGAQGLSKDVKTPHLDSIAENGVRFTSAYVTAPVCAPMRAALMAGRYQQRFGFELNPGGVNYPNYGLPTDEVTVADVMRSAGYHTGMIGKWHIGNKKPLTPLERGFDEFYGFWGGAHSYIEQTPGFNAVRSGDERVKKVDYLTDAFGREAAEFVERNHEAPFFLYLAFNSPHQPLQAPQKYLDRFPNVKDRKRRLFLAMMSAMDDAVGQMLNALRQHDLERQTLIVFTSDNGGPTDGNTSRNTPFSGYKAQLFEGGIRVPMFAQWKGRVPAGRVIEQPVSSLDFFATAAAVGDAKVPQDRALDGVNLLPWLEGEQQSPVHERLYWRYGPQWAIREGDWKLMGVGDYAKLFNLADDPGEKQDRSEDQPEVRKKLLAAYADWNQHLVAPLWVPEDFSMMDKHAFNTQESPHKTRERRSAESKRNPKAG